MPAIALGLPHRMKGSGRKLGFSCIVCVIPILALSMIGGVTGARVAYSADAQLRSNPQPELDRTDREAFIAWAGQARVSLATPPQTSEADALARLGTMIGEARIVALTEGVHLASEPLAFRNQVIQYLVRQKGFNVIAIESGIVESRGVYDYVAGGTGTLETVLQSGIVGPLIGFHKTPP